MPTARSLPGVLSLQSALVVAGGDTLEPSSYTAAVEIFKPDTSQWYRTDPLPTACREMSLVAIGNTCYALGGWNGSHLNQALCASVDDLLGNAVPANQTTHSGSSGSAWKKLPNPPGPTYDPAVAVLAGNLLAIGGDEKTGWGLPEPKEEIYMYSPSTNSWIYNSELPAPLCSTAAAVLSSTEILVIGGWARVGGWGFLASSSSISRMKTVYKGTLQMTP